MSGQSLKTELERFVEFATRHIERGEGGESVEDLVRQWRHDTEFADVVADVRQGLVDDADGRAESVTDSFADVRRRLGIAE